ncbi:G-protein coupled receptor 84-like [Ciona intestinalis]
MDVNSTNSSLSAIADFRYIGIVIGIVDIILGTMGNILTIVVFSRISNLQSSFNIFIINLAIIDFLTAAFMMPFNVAGYVQMNWPIGGPDSLSASIQAYVYFCCGYTSITCFMLITVNRFISVMFPKHYKSLFSRCGILVGLVSSWLIAPAFLLPVLLDSAGGLPIIGWNQKQFLCTFIHVTGKWRTYMQVLRVLFQFLPIVTMIVLYSLMFWRLKRKWGDENGGLPWEKQSKNGPDAVELMAMNERGVKLNEDEAKEARRQVVERKKLTEKRLLTVSVVICCTFVLLFLPSLIVNLISGSENLDPRVHMVASNITWLNSCVNPFIYVMLNPDFRMEYRIILKYLWLKITCKL